MRSWRRVRGDPEAYLRRTMYRMAVDSWRVRRRQGVVSLCAAEFVEPVNRAGGLDGMDGVAERDALVGALAALPPRQRAVLVLRYWEQMSEAETAAVLGCTAGTVKSSASRGLARMRELTRTWDGTSNSNRGRV